MHTFMRSIAWHNTRKCTGRIYYPLAYYDHRSLGIHHGMIEWTPHEVQLGT